MVFRALGMGGALTVPEPLVHYRRDGTSNHPVAAAAITGERLRAWRERQNRRLLAETRQLMQDAAALDQAAAVAAALAPTLQRECFMHQAMAAGDLHARWQALRAAPTLPLAWRLRKLLFFAAPAAAAMSAALRRWRQRVRAR
jgi:hypothetical protein